LTKPKFVLMGVLMLVASPFVIIAVVFVVPQFGLFLITMAFLSMIALNVVGGWLIPRLVSGAPRFPWPRGSLVALPAEIAYLAALIGTMVVTGLVWGAYEKKLPKEVRAMLGKAR